MSQNEFNTEKIDISHHYITGEGAVIISGALQVNRIIQEF